MLRPNTHFNAALNSFYKRFKSLDAFTIGIYALIFDHNEIQFMKMIFHKLN